MHSEQSRRRGAGREGYPPPHGWCALASSWLQRLARRTARGDYPRPSRAVCTERRHEMVETQLIARGIHDPIVLMAMRTVPREAFVPSVYIERAYTDTPLPLGEGQTISQPYIVAWIVEALQLPPESRVLEIGTGSGYAAAVLSCIAHQVHTVERLAPLASGARHRLRRLGYRNVYLRQADGTVGWPAHAPYQGIVVSAGGPYIPPALQAQLALDGRLVIPVGTHPRWQQLVRVTRTSATTFRHEALGGVRFVPLIGVQGWPTRPPDD